MKFVGFAAVVAATIVTAASVQTAAQDATLAGDLLKDWRAQRETMLKIADAMPEEKFGFKATPPERSYGEQILHVAGANIFLIKFLGGKDIAPAISESDRATFGLKATSKAEILDALRRSYDFGEAVIKDVSDAQFAKSIQGPPYLGYITPAKLVYYTMGHALDIYGQMVVYLRLNGIVPPASRRGSV